MSDEADIIKGLAPIPRHDGDIAGRQDGVQFGTFQGKRDYQEDRFVIRSGVEVGAEKAQGFLAGLFGDAAQATSRHVSGSTGTAVLLTQDGRLDAAYLGDSPVVLFVRDPKKGDVFVKKLSRDHHAAFVREKKKVEEAGGRVHRNGRVGGSLMLSRAFGDATIKGVLREPEFAAIDIRKYTDEGKEVYVLVSSDGLYDDAKPADYIAPLKKAIAEGKEDRLAEVFAAHAHKSGSEDNITALVYKVPAKMKSGLFLAIADGHGGGQASRKVAKVFADGAETLRQKPAP